MYVYIYIYIHISYIYVQCHMHVCMCACIVDCAFMSFPITRGVRVRQVVEAPRVPHGSGADSVALLRHHCGVDSGEMKHDHPY